MGAAHDACRVTFQCTAIGVEAFATGPFHVCVCVCVTQRATYCWRVLFMVECAFPDAICTIDVKGERLSTGCSHNRHTPGHHIVRTATAVIGGVATQYSLRLYILP